MTLFVPYWICAIAGGLLFGPFHGALYALAGGTLGATGVYLLSRLGLSGFTRLDGKILRGVEAGFQAHGVAYLIGLRLVPLFPFVAVNIASALLRLPLKVFILGTMTGMIPVALIYANIGSVLKNVSATDGARCNPGPSIFLPLAALALLVLLPVAYKAFRSHSSTGGRATNATGPRTREDA